MRRSRTSSPRRENDKRYGPESSIGTKPEEMFAKLEKNYADFSARSISAAARDAPLRAILLQIFS